MNNYFLRMLNFWSHDASARSNWAISMGAVRVHLNRDICEICTVFTNFEQWAKWVNFWPKVNESKQINNLSSPPRIGTQMRTRANLWLLCTPERPQRVCVCWAVRCVCVCSVYRWVCVCARIHSSLDRMPYFITLIVRMAFSTICKVHTDGRVMPAVAAVNIIVWSCVHWYSFHNNLCNCIALCDWFGGPQCLQRELTHSVHSILR